MAETIPFTEKDLCRQAAINSGEYEHTFGGGFAAGWEQALQMVLGLIDMERLSDNTGDIEDYAYMRAIEDIEFSVRNFRRDN